MRTFLVVLLLTLVPFAAAQTHEHESGDGAAVVLHDGPKDGRAVVGSLTHFGFVLIGKDNAPTVHRNAQFQVFQNDVQIFSTEDTHEYDGILSFDMMFTREGPYKVMAMSDKMAMGEFDGVAVQPTNATQAKIEFKRGSDAPTSNVLSGTLSILDTTGALIPHSDAIVEIREKASQKLTTRFHAHIHEDAIQFTQALGPATDYVMHVTAYNAYPTGKHADYEAVVADIPVTVGRVAAPALPENPGMPGVLKPMGAKASEGGFTLYGMYDPQNQVGVGQPIRLAAAIMNAENRPEAHVDFDVLVKGPRGTVFQSKSLHEYDGVFEYEFVPDVPGLYDASVTALLDSGKLTVPYRFQVLPPVVAAFGGGIGIVTIKGLDSLKAGEPSELTFRVAGPQGAVQHSEVDVTIWHADEAPAFQFKLHTHESGDTKAQVVLPHEGDWTITVDPSPTVPQTVVFQGPKGPNMPIAFAAKVAPGVAGEVVGKLAQQSATKPVPTVGLVGVVGLIGLVAIASRRR